MTHPDSAHITLHSDTPEATMAFAAHLAMHCPDTAVLYLQGELGAGKSLFARAFLQRLGVMVSIKSPTYTLVEIYTLPDGSSAAHLDLYRIADPEELDYLALDDILQNLRVMLVEWPQHGVERLPAADLCIIFSGEGTDRLMKMQAQSDGGRRWLQCLAAPQC